MEVDGRLFLLDDLRDLLDRLHSADLVVHIHDGHQDRIVADRLAECIQGDMSVVVDRKVGHAETKFFKKCCRIVDGRMFHAGGNDVVSGALVCKRRADQSHVVGLRSAGGKEDLLVLYL